MIKFLFEQVGPCLISQSMFLDVQYWGRQKFGLEQLEKHASKFSILKCSALCGCPARTKRIEKMALCATGSLRLGEVTAPDAS